MGRKAVAAWIFVLGVTHLAGCRQDPPAPKLQVDKPPAAIVPSDCGHAVCADNFFVDTESAGRCAVGSTCTLRLKLVATGNFHVNEEYPYKFRADDAAGVHFLGSDEAAKNVFSKAAGDWQSVDAKSGAMTVKFTPAGSGETRIGGVLKLSVCSGDVCQLEQSRITVPIAVD
jgi:hypothetical protein